MRCLAAAAAFVAMLAAAHPSGAVRPFSNKPKLSASLCHVPETALFTCKVGTRVVSICGQPQGGHDQGGHDQGGHDQGGAVYRFGRRGHIELEVAGLHYVQHGFSGGGETQVYADTSTHRYIVYDQIVRTAFGPDGHHDPQAESGLLVQSDGKIVSSQTCSEPTTFSPFAEKVMPEGDYVPH